MLRYCLKRAMSLGVVFVATASLNVMIQTTRAQSPTPIPAGTVRKDAKGIEQVYVPAGCFMMGTVLPEGTAKLDMPSWAKEELKSEMPAHEVCLSKGYWIDKFEVTNAAFQAFKEDGGYENKAYWSKEGNAWRLGRGASLKNYPVKCIDSSPDVPRVCITWYEAEAYANWRGGRLPTEAEWEYAARGPKSSVFPWGDTWDETKANIVGSTGLKAVGSYPDGASWVGALDMSGNAMEWVSDWLDTAYYATSPKVDPKGPETGSHKVEKGGWWGAPAFVGRAAYRHFEDPPDYQDKHIGFRVVSAE